MSNIFKNEKNFITVNKEWIIKLKNEAKNSEKKTSRLLMHLDTQDHVQEMIIAFGKEAVIPPNKSENKSESLQVVEGKMLLVIFNDNGNVDNKIEMQPLSEGGNNFIYRFNKCMWHTMIALSEIVVVHEILEGPFIKEDGNNIPSWVPKNTSDTKKLMQSLR